MIDMHSSMLENGLDFIYDATKQMNMYEESSDDTEKRKALKYALLHLLSGIELVMKSRLFIENWTYIFAEMEKADKTKLTDGTLVTVEYSKCINRLKQLCNVNVKDETAFEDLRRCRNQVEHFYTTENVVVIETKINRALTATVNFLKDNYEEFESPSVIDLRKNVDLSLTEGEKKYIQDINIAVNSLDKHHQDAVDLARKRAKSIRLKDELYVCPDCKERVLVVSDENNDEMCKCYLCGYEKNGIETAHEYIEKVLGINEYRTIKDGGEFPLYTCPECGKTSFVKTKNKFVCFSCRMEYKLDEVRICSQCGELYVCFDDEDIGLCDNCEEQLKERMDKE